MLFSFITIGLGICSVSNVIIFVIFQKFWFLVIVLEEYTNIQIPYLILWYSFIKQKVAVTIKTEIYKLSFIKYQLYCTYITKLLSHTRATSTKYYVSRRTTVQIKNMRHFLALCSSPHMLIFTNEKFTMILLVFATTYHLSVHYKTWSITHALSSTFNDEKI